MKAIKYIVFLLFFLFLACAEEENYLGNYDFVRFSLVVNTNGTIIESPKIETAINETNTYTHKSTKPIKIPIALSTPLQNTDTEIYYSVTKEGSFSDYSFSSVDKIIIPAGKLVDTLAISFNDKWQVADVNKITLKITGTNNPKVRIGWNRTKDKMDELTITLGELDKTFYFFENSLYNLKGTIAEELIIPIVFSQPVTNAMVTNFNFIDAVFAQLSSCESVGSSFNYSLQQLPIVNGSMKINYKLTVLTSTAFPSNLKLTLNSGLPNFIVGATNTTNVKKESSISRQGDVAKNWYDVTIPLHRTYGKAWYFSTADGFCRWSTFSAFTKPVVVTPGSEFDNGQGFHKYKIGFIGPNPPIGTNPFDLQRYYNNTASNVSPAYNITEALEFFPENGNSTTKGVVKVIAQNLAFTRSSDNKNIVIPICGSGTYSFDSVNNRFVIYLELRCDETAIGGKSDVIKPMYIYNNNNSSTNPPNLTIACPNRVNL